MAIFLPGWAENSPLRKTIRCGFTHGANWASGPGLAKFPGKSRNCNGLGQTIVQAATRWESRNNRKLNTRTNAKLHRSTIRIWIRSDATTNDERSSEGRIAASGQLAATKLSTYRPNQKLTSPQTPGMSPR